MEFTRNYAYTMQLVAQLIIDGETSFDPNDKVGPSWVKNVVALDHLRLIIMV